MQLPRWPSRHDIHAASGLLATQILVLFAVATLAPLVVALVHTQTDAREAERHAFENALSVAGVGAAGVEAIIRDAQQEAQVIARLPAFWNGADGDRDRILSAFVAAQPTFNALVYFTPDFQTHGNSNYDPATGRGNVARRAYAREAVANGQLAVTDEALLAVSNPVPVLPVAVPLHEAAPAGRVGFLSAGLHIDRLTSLWTDLPLPQGSTVTLLDTREGRILAATGEMGSRINETIDAASLERIRAGEATFRRTAGDGNASLWAWQRVERTPWVVAIDIPGAAVLDPIYAQANRRALANLAISVATGMLLLLLWRRLSPRLGALQQAAANWAQGDWRYRTRIAGRDELGQLGVAFDGMAEQLRQQELERQKTEEVRSQLAAIVESSSDAIISKDLDGVITSWNRGAERLYGYAADEVIGRPVSMLVPPALRNALAQLQDRVKRGERVEDCETVRIARDGRHIDVSMSLFPIQDAAGRITAIAAITRDMTERRAVERLKDEFVSTVSHELRTPMNGVIGMTGLLLNTELTARQRGYADTIRQSGEALLTIIDDILDLSKIEAGKLELERTDLEVRELVDGVAGLLAEQAEGKGVELAVFVHRDVPARLGGDPGRLRQILLNLVGNAVKFTEQGAVLVRARLAAETTDEVVIRFEVVDTGIGISPEAQERLFQPFSQADGSTTRQYGGTGLGLVICKRLVALMGGEIGVESQPGRGSTFWFTARFERTAASSPLTAGGTGLEGLRVLIAEGSATSRHILREQIASWQMVGDCAEDGPRALELLRAAAAAGQPYAVALLDSRLPGLNGLELASAIKADPAIADIRLILLRSLAHGQGDDLAAASIAAALTRPLRESQLFDALAQVMDTSVPVAPSGLLPAAPGSRRHPSAWSVGPRILVAEDSPINQQVAVGILEALGYVVDVVSNGQEAVEALDRVPYAAVLMDCQMPVLDGFGASAEIRRRPAGDRDVPIIALTAAAMKGEQERCLAAGMDDYVAKPFRPDQLAAVLQRWIPGLEEPAVGGQTHQPGSRRSADPPVPDSVRDLAALDRVDPKLEGKLIALFLRDAPTRLATIRAAVEQDDAPALVRAAHLLRGEASLLYARELETIGDELERLGRAATLEGASALVEDLEAAFQRTAAVLRSRGAACLS